VLAHARALLTSHPGALPSGAYLLASHFTAEHDKEQAEASEGAFHGSGTRGELRDSG